jgi:serine/threonine-protein kinase
VLTRLGKFEIVRLLAQGSMGDVYVGRDPILGREVAIKVIQTSAAAGPAARERFATEARAAGVLNHPNIVTIHELGEEQGVLFLAMELVKGEDLGTLIRASTLTPRDTLEVLAQVCDGLAMAHRHQVLHRDIKPSNIRVVWDGKNLQAKILDFGVAKVLDSDTTDEGTVLGTVNYMAPEYLQSGKPDARSDLFAVGVVLYEALAGFPPFDGPSPGAVIYRLLHEAPPALPPTACQGVSRDVPAILNHALAKDPANRFQSAEELASVLRAAKEVGWHWEQEKPTGALRVKAHLPPSKPTATPPTPPRGLRVSRAAAPPLRPGSATTRSSQGVTQEAVAQGAAPAGGADVRRDVLETTRRQLQQSLEIDPGNPRTLGMLLVTFYRLGRMGAVIQCLRQAQERGVTASALKALPRVAQMVAEEQQRCLLPLDLHQEFMGFMGH